MISLCVALTLNLGFWDNTEDLLQQGQKQKMMQKTNS